MYSNGTIKTLQLTINAGNKLKLFPFKLVISPNGIPILQKETNKFQYILWKLLTVYFVAVQLIYLAFGIWFDLSYNIVISNRVQFYILVPAFIMGISGLILMLTSWEIFISAFNSLLLFGHKLHIYHGTTKNRKDGVELPLKMFVMSACTVALLSPLITFTWISKKVHLWSILNGDIIFGIILCAGIPSIVLAGFSVVFFLVAPAINYVRMTNTSFNLMTYNSENPLTSKAKRELISIYRAHQILNNMINEELRTTVLIGVSTGALIMIIMSYALIGFSHILPIELFIATACPLILTFFVDYYCFGYSANMVEASKMVPSSYLGNEVSMRRIHRKCFKACKPLYIKVGDVGKLDKLTFPVFMNEVVIARVVDLLLMYS